MTLESVSRYDRTRLSRGDGRAVVVGASIAGLVTARVLADRFEAVTVIERDSLPDEPSTRRGVPQGRHVHVLQEAGRATFEDLFPGYGEELLSFGGLMIDGLSDLRYYDEGGFLADGPTRLPMYCASRPLFEQVIRRRASECDTITLRSNCQFTEYLVDRGATAVDGVRLRGDTSDPEDLAAELVVDATGRTSQTPTWLDAHGYAAPEVDEVRIGLAYSSAVLERPADDRRAFFVPPDPPRTRGAGMFPIEDGRWLLTVLGVHGDHPPTDAERLRSFAATLPVPELTRLLENRPWVSDEIAHYPFPSNRRHRYEDLDRFPDGLVVIGDAISSFNPVYGQGMSVAALEALVLHHQLATTEPRRIAPRFFDRVEEIVDVPWAIAVGGDFEFPQTEGPKPRGTDVFNRYLARMIRKAHADGTLREALSRVFMMERPPSSLLQPRIMWRVLRPTGPRLRSTSRSVSDRRSKRTS